MPAPNLGLVGAYGGEGLQQEIQKMIAERRAQEQLAYENMIKQREQARLDAQQRAQESYQGSQVERERRRNEIYGKEADTNLLEAQNRAKATPKRSLLQVKTVDPKTGKDAILLYDDDTGQEVAWYPDQASANAAGGDFAQYVARVEGEKGRKVTAAELQDLHNKWPERTERNELSEWAKMQGTMNMAKDWKDTSANYRLARSAVRRMEAAWQTAKQDPSAMPGVAESLRVLFLKTTDERSVVMPGEFLRGSITQPIFNKIRAFVNAKVGRGGVPQIPPDQWPVMIEIARNMSRAMEKDLEGDRAEAQARATRFLGPDGARLVLGEDYKDEATPGPPPPGVRPPAAPADAGRPPGTLDPASSHQTLELGPGERRQGSYVVKDRPDGNGYEIVGRIVNNQIVRQ